MTKGKIITLSILLLLIILSAILFGAVFCLREQKVVVLGESPITASREEIVTTAGLKNGKSIFMLDKDKAINNIEQKYPYIKVIQIKTTSVTKIEIRVRARHEMYYTKSAENFYVMDEELKVLRIIESAEQEPTNLTYIKENTLDINSSTLVCDFVGTETQAKALNGLFEAMYTNVTKTVDGNEVYLTRQDICSLIKNVQFESFDTFDKIIITTSYGVKLDIENPTKDLKTKINICFSKIDDYILEGENKHTKGTIKLFYGLDKELKFSYIEE